MSGLDVLATGPAWRAQGACVGEPPDWWYPRDGDTTSQAVAICATCPVLIQCRQWGLQHEKHGVWGGTSEKERRRLRRQLGIRVSTPEEQAGGDDWRRERAGHLFAQGWRAGEISAELGVELRTVHRWLEAIAPAYPPQMDAGDAGDQPTTNTTHNDATATA